MNRTNIEKIGEFLAKVRLIDDYEIEDFGIDCKWIKVVFYLNTKEIQSLSVIFNKEHGYIMNMSFEETIDF